MSEEHKLSAEQILSDTWRQETKKWFINSTANKYKHVFLKAMENFSSLQNAYLLERVRLLEEENKKLRDQQAMDSCSPPSQVRT